MKFLSVEPGGIPDELKDIDRWVVWRAISRDGKPTKRPFKVNGEAASVTDSSTWVDFETAQAALGSGFDGIGLVLNGDGIVGLDFDHCRCPGLDGVDDGITDSLEMVDPKIAEHLKDLNGYTEASPSGHGIRVMVRGTLPVERRKKEGPIELYSSGRYVTMTGHVLDGFPRDIPTRTVELQAFYKRIFGEAGGEKAVGPEPKLSRDWHERLDRVFASED